MECLDPMAKLIEDRSFVASEMTPEMVVERVKRSCDVKDFDVTVETMKSNNQQCIIKYP